MVEQWSYEKLLEDLSDHVVLARAAQWGADQELAACLADVHATYGKGIADWLRSMRRPKPLSLKEQAIEDWDRLVVGKLCTDETCIRKALEALPND